MFVISLTYVCEMGDIDAHLSAHVAYLERQYAAGVFLASGRKVPRTGGVILANVETRKQLEQILADDPFKQHGLADYDITEFMVTKASSELQCLLEQ